MVARGTAAELLAASGKQKLTDAFLHFAGERRMRPAWRILLGKELLDVARDRRTLLLTILLPVLLYPGILLLMGAIIAAGTQRLKNEPLTIALVGPATAALLAKKPVPAKTTFEPRERAEAEQLLRDQKLAAVVQAPPDARGPAGGRAAGSGDGALHQALRSVGGGARSHAAAAREPQR